MAYTKEYFSKKWAQLTDYNVIVGGTGVDVVTTSPRLVGPDDTNHVASEDQANLLALGAGDVNVKTGASDDFLWMRDGNGFVDLGGGENWANFQYGRYTLDVNDETEITTIAGFDESNDRLRYRGSNEEAFHEALVDGAVDFALGRTDDIEIEFDDTTLLLENFQGDVNRFVISTADYDTYFDFKLQVGIGEIVNDFG